MAAQKIMETTINPIIAHVKATQAATFAAIRADNTDNLVNTNPFVEYLSFEKAIGYQVPCLFVLGRSIDFAKSRGQNFINCVVTVQVSALVDDSKEDLLTLKTWRYHDALHMMLDRAELKASLQSPGGQYNVMNKVKVVHSDFGELVSMKSSIGKPFRKEVLLTLEVEHYEQEG